jgi:hypothetical protein
MLEHPNFKGKEDRQGAMDKEVNKNFYSNVRLATMSDFFKDKKLFGDRTTIGHLVVDIKLKAAADGEPTIPRVRFTFAAPREGSPEDKFVFYSGCDDSTTNRVTVQWTLQRNAKHASDDVSGAYWKGKPSLGNKAVDAATCSSQTVSSGSILTSSPQKIQQADDTSSSSSATCRVAAMQAKFGRRRTTNSSQALGLSPPHSIHDASAYLTTTATSSRSFTLTTRA